MTRHGTLAYYLAAWVIGCFVLALDVWLDGLHSGSARASDLIFIYFFGLAFGASDVLLFAFILRKSMSWLGARQAPIWAFAGAVLSLVLVFFFARIADKLPERFLKGPVDYLYQFVLAGPESMAGTGSSAWWHAPIDGGIVAGILWLIDRAFNPPAPVTPHSQGTKVEPTG